MFEFCQLEGIHFFPKCLPLSQQGVEIPLDWRIALVLKQTTESHYFFTLSRGVSEGSREGADLWVWVDGSCDVNPALGVGEDGVWCLENFSSHALLLTAHSTQEASGVGGNGKSSSGKHLLTPRTDWARFGNTCHSQIKPTGVTQPPPHHVPCSSLGEQPLSRANKCPVSCRLCSPCTLNPRCS